MDLSSVLLLACNAIASVFPLISRLSGVVVSGSALGSCTVIESALGVIGSVERDEVRITSNLEGIL